MLSRKTIESWPRIGEGTNRVVYLTPSRRYVIKVVKNVKGRYDNYAEQLIYKLKIEFFVGRLARCKLIQTKDDSKALLMEYLAPLNLANEVIPDWAEEVDYKVGASRDGRILAYNWA